MGPIPDDLGPDHRGASRDAVAVRHAEALRLLAERGGRLLAGVVEARESRLSVRCQRGHDFSSSLLLLRRGHWCRRCAVDSRKYRGPSSIDAMRALAISQGGECLSTDYHGSGSPLEWRCGLGHTWKAKPANISQGRWCPYCARLKRSRKHTVEFCQMVAEERGGKFLDAEFGGSTASHRWQCEHGHEWTTTLKSVREGKWCHVCGGSVRITLDDARRLASSRGGSVHSLVREGRHLRGEWECAHGHRWVASYNAVSSKGSWCPECSSGLGERLCRAVFEQLFSRPFPRVRPDWLLSPEGNRMELDGCCAELSLAFEHQGVQHYKDVAGMQRGGDLARRQMLDAYKRAACAERGIVLIEVPDVHTMVGVRRLAAYVHDACVGAGVPPDHGAHAAPIDYRAAYLTNDAVDTTRQLSRRADERGGMLVSELYLGHREKLHWRCSAGHEWYALPQSILAGYWCLRCSRASRRTTEAEIARLVATKGGVVLKVGADGSVGLRCREGHEWTVQSAHNLQRSWCPNCAGNSAIGLEWVQEYATSRGGLCLSGVYMNNISPLLLRCAMGHEWSANAIVLRRGGWCRRCASRKTERVVESIQGIICAKNGELLGLEWVASKSRQYAMLRCAAGHEWSTVPSVLRRGGWCPVCARESRPR